MVEVAVPITPVTFLRHAQTLEVIQSRQLLGNPDVIMKTRERHTYSQFPFRPNIHTVDPKFLGLRPHA